MKNTLPGTKPLFWSGALFALSLSLPVWAHEEASAAEKPAHEEHATHESHETHEVSAAHEAQHATRHEMPTLALEEGESGKGKFYRVRPGDSLDRIIQKALPNSPLKIEYLRDAVVRANPGVFAHSGSYRIHSGQVLQLPDLAQVLRATMEPLLQSSESKAQTDEQIRRRWVHYP
jgi:Tfp pilus assembly protein FimV